MIKEHNVIGSKDTSLHDFIFTQSDMDINLSAGTYTRAHLELFNSNTGALINIPTPLIETHYEIWLNDVGIVVLSRENGQEFGEIISPIDRLAWFSVPANATNLDTVEINTIRVVEG